LGTTHWLVGALKLAAHRFDAARNAFEQAQRAYLSDETLLPQALMARGYIALTAKADPQSPENADTLNDALDRLRSEGSKESIFFADQIATANRLLFESKGS
jgi:ABC-type amino acid transport substrate-binding protein